MKVNEIFNSLQGECDGFGEQGKPTTFIRLQGCNLTCKWCDTQWAQDHFTSQDIPIIDVVDRVDMPKVTITGGEPLLQYDEVQELTARLVARRIRVTIETNGTVQVLGSFMDPSERAVWLRIIMDYKLPSSGVESAMNASALSTLCSYDVVKFIIADDWDYARMKELIIESPWTARFAVSPTLKLVAGKVTAITLQQATRLAERMLGDPDLKHAYFNLQLHKLLGVK